MQGIVLLMVFFSITFVCSPWMTSSLTGTASIPKTTKYRFPGQHIKEFSQPVRSRRFRVRRKELRPRGKRIEEER